MSDPYACEYDRIIGKRTWGKLTVAGRPAVRYHSNDIIDLASARDCKCQVSKYKGRVRGDIAVSKDIYSTEQGRRGRLLRKNIPWRGIQRYPFDGLVLDCERD